MSEKEKTYTLKTVQAELRKLKKEMDKKTDTIQRLQTELRADKKQCKALISIFNDLCQEDLQRQIADAWFKEQKLTGEQVQKLLELSKQLHGKIDQLNVDAIVQAVREQETERLPVSSEHEKVDTSINFSEDTHSNNEKKG